MQRRAAAPVVLVVAVMGLAVPAGPAHGSAAVAAELETVPDGNPPTGRAEPAVADPPTTTVANKEDPNNEDPNNSESDDGSRSVALLQQTILIAEPNNFEFVNASGQLMLTWSKPFIFPSYVSLAGYDVQYRDDPDASWTDYSGTIGASATSVTLTGLTNHTIYDVRLRGRSSSEDGRWAELQAMPAPVIDISYLDTISANPLRIRDLAVHGSHVWITVQGSKTIYAFNLNGDRASDRDWTTYNKLGDSNEQVGNHSPWGICIDGRAAWVSDTRAGRGTFRYPVSGSTFDNTAPGEYAVEADGLWCDGDTLLAHGKSGGTVALYTRESDTSYQHDRDIPLAGYAFNAITASDTRIAVFAHHGNGLVAVSPHGAGRIGHLSIDADAAGFALHGAVGASPDGSGIWVADVANSRLVQLAKPALDEGPPVPVEASVSLDKVKVTFNQSLDTGVAPAADRFRVTVGNQPAAAPTAAVHTTADDESVTLTLSSRPPGDYAVSVAYTDKTRSDDTEGVVQATDGTDALRFPTLRAANTNISGPQSFDFGISSAALAFTWSAPSTGTDMLTGYVLQYREHSDNPGAAWTDYSGTLGPSATSATVTRLTDYTLYEARLAARTGSNDSDIGPHALVTAMPAPVIDLGSLLPDGATVRGVTGEGSLLWVAAEGDLAVRAFSKDGTRAGSSDFTLPDYAAKAQGICIDGRAAWISDTGSSGSRDDDKLFRFAKTGSGFETSTVSEIAVEDPAGLWCDGDTLLVARGRGASQQIAAYERAGDTSYQRDSDRDIALADGAARNYRGVWADSQLAVWASRAGPDQAGDVIAMSPTGAGRLQYLDVMLAGTGIGEPGGIWSDGSHLWVVNPARAKVVKLPLPALDAGPPLPVESTLAGDTVTVTFNQSLDTDVTPAAGRFRVTVGNQPAAAPTAAAHVTADDKSVALTLAASPQGGDTVTVAYTDKTGSDDTEGVVQATDGTDATAFTKLRVANTNDGKPGPPESLSLKVGETSLELSWSEPAGVTATAPITSYVFRYRKAGTSGWTTPTRSVPTALTESLSGLDNDVVYDLEVAAHNRLGGGDYAAVAARTAESIDLSDTLSGSISVRGLWSDGTTLWAVEDNARVARAFTLSTKARDTARDLDFGTLTGTTASPTGICSDGTTTWIAGHIGQTHTLYAFERSGNAWTYQSSDNIDPGGTYPQGLWCDSESLRTVVGLGSDAQTANAHSLPGGDRDEIVDVALPGAGSAPSQHRYRGVWSDGAMMWASRDGGDGAEVVAMLVHGGRRYTSLDHGPDRLAEAGIESPQGIWSDGDDLWVADLDGQIVKLPLKSYNHEIVPVSAVWDGTEHVTVFFNRQLEEYQHTPFHRPLSVWVTEPGRARAKDNTTDIVWSNNYNAIRFALHWSRNGDEHVQVEYERQWGGPDKNCGTCPGTIPRIDRLQADDPFSFVESFLIRAVVAVPGRPKNMSQQTDGLQIDLSWEAPDHASDNTAYDIRYRTIYSAWTNHTRSDDTALAETITVPSDADDYRVQIRVRTNLVNGEGYNSGWYQFTEQESTSATGTPSVSGTPQVGTALTAGTSGISDANGVPDDPDDFTYQWRRDSSDIAGATAPNYWPTAADVGSTISVEVSFTDYAGDSEGPLTSAETATVAASTTQSVLWSATMTVGSIAVDGRGTWYGFHRDTSAGQLSTQTFTLGGTTHTVESVLGETRRWFRVDPELSTPFTFAHGGLDPLSPTSEVRLNGETLIGFGSGSPGWEEGDKVAVALIVTNEGATGMPTISGPRAVGETLTADTSAISDVNGVPATFTYQWLAAGSPISGATDGTYVVKAADQGREISVRVSFTDLGGFSEGPLTSDAVTPQAALAPATGTPSVSGTPQVGAALTAGTAAISDANGVPDDPDDFTYQWRRGSRDIAGATAPNYWPTAADVGGTISVEVSFTDYAGQSEGPLTSAASAAVVAQDSVRVPWSTTMTVGSLAVTGGRTWYGFHGEFDTGQLSTQTFTLGDTAYTVESVLGETRRWFRVDPELSTPFTFAHGGLDPLSPTSEVILDGETLIGFGSGSPGWEEGDRVALALVLTNSAATGSLAVTGTAATDETLTADTSGISDSNGVPATFTYQWLADGTAISGATDGTYAVQTGDVGKAISARVTFTDLAGFDEGPFTSNAKTVIEALVPATGTPSVSGTPQVGMVLTADVSGIADENGVPDDVDSFSYQWLADGTAISGATAPHYWPTATQAGDAISVRVSFTDDVGQSEGPLTSNESAAVADSTTVKVALSATVTVGIQRDAQLDLTNAGYTNPSFGAISRRQASLGGTSYGIFALVYNASTGAVWIRTSPEIPSDFGLGVGAAGLGPANARAGLLNNLPAVNWASAEPDWSAGDKVAVALIVTDVAAAGKPAVTTPAREGQTLSVDTSAISDANGVPDDADDFTYQWLADGTAISGATDGTYVAKAADVGMGISVRVSFTDLAGFSEGPLTSDATIVVQSLVPATGAPSVSGTPQVGMVLTADVSGIADENGVPDDVDSFSYQWRRGGTNISGATAPHYWPTAADAAETISVRVRFTDEAGQSEGPLTSAESAEVADSTTTRVPWSATMTVGAFTTDTLSTLLGHLHGSDGGALSDTTFTLAGTEFTVSDLLWTADDRRLLWAVDPAIASSFTLVYGGNNRLNKVRDRESAVNERPAYWFSLTASGWDEGDKVAVALVVTDAAATGAPLISGTGRLGGTLTADTSGISDNNGVPATFTYQWLADGTAISGATASTYVVKTADVGKAVTLRVSFTDLAGFSEGPLTSSAVQATPLPGVPVSETTLTVAEGGSGTYTLKLTTQPTSDVVIDLAAGGDVTVSPARLRFNSGNWDTARTITVRAAQDGDAVNDPAVTVTHTIDADDSDDEYDSVTIGSVEVTITEDDMPSLSVAGVRAGEADGTVTFTVSISSTSSSRVTVRYATSNGTAAAGSDYTAASGTLTFPALSTTSRSIAVAVTDDNIDENNETFTLTLSNASNATLDGGGATLAVTGTITDNDTAGTELSLDPAELTVAEGGSGTYTLKLTTQPTSDVVIDLADGDDVTASPARLTFTSRNWSTARTITVRAAQDDDAASDPAVTVTHTIDADDSADEYDSVTIDSVEVTITEDDSASLSVSNVRAGEADGTVTFTVSISAASSDRVTVRYATSNGTAAAGSDYTAASGTLTFPALSTTSQSIAVAVTDDDIVENNETFTLTLSNASNATLAGGGSTLAATGTITDNDTAGTELSLDPAELTVAEGGSGTYTLKLTTQPTSDVVIDLADGGDVTASPARLRFNSGNWDTARTITVRAAQDSDAVNDPAVTVTHTIDADDSADEYDSVTIDSVEVTITEDDTPSLSVAGVRAGEADGTVTFTVSISTTSSDRVTVRYATSNGTAAAGSDYTAASGTLTFAALSTTSQSIAVAVADDDIDENNETFTLTLSNASNATLDGGGATLAVTGTITDNDAAGTELSLDPALLTVAEGGSGTYTLKLTTQPTSDVVIDVAAADDVTASPARLRFTSGNWDTAQTITVNAAADSDAVSDPAVTVTHTIDADDSADEYDSVTIDSVRVTITETDTPSLSVAGVSVGEADGTVTFTVSISAASSNRVTVRYATSNGTAAAGSDYTAASGTLTFPALSTTSRSIAVAVTDDDIDENNETFTLTLSNASNGSLDGGGSTLAVTGTITDDDTAGTELSLDPAELTVTEGGSGTYTLELTTQPTSDVVIDLAAGGDVTASPARLTFTSRNWDTARTITVRAAQDSDAVNDPAVTVTHTIDADDSADEYDSVTIGSVEVTITEDDSASLSVADVRAGEADGTVTFTVSISASSSEAVTVAYATSNGTAAAGSDYTAASGTLTFPALSTTSQSIAVAVTDDDIDENNEIFTLTLSNASNGSLDGGGSTLAATGTITDDDTADTELSLDPALLTVAEGGSGTYTLKLTTQPTSDVVIDLAAADDVTASPARLTFTSGNWDTAQTITVNAAQDDDTASDPAVTVTHTIDADDSADEYDSVTIGSVEVTITEDDTASLSVASVSVGESAGRLVFTVSISTASSDTVTVAYATSNGTAVAGSDYTPASGTLTFPAGSTRSQTISVSVSEDVIDENDETLSLELSNAQGASLSGGNDTLAVQGTIRDNDTASVSLSRERRPALRLDEQGPSGSYTIVLGTEPSADVRIDITAGGDVSASPATLTFTPGDWSAPKTVTVSALGDDDAVNDSVTITHEVAAAASADEYDDVTVADVDVEVDDDDTAAVDVSTESLSLSEGGQGSYTIVLGTEPSADVRIDITAGGDVSASPATLTFTPGDWSAPKTVTVSALGDDDAVNDSVTITHEVAAAASADEYDDVTVADVHVEVNDDDTAAVDVSTESLSLSEGGQGSYTIALDTEPSADVRIDITAGGDVSASPARVTFTPTTWRDPQTITVVDSSDADAVNDSVTITHEVAAAASADEYDDVTVADVHVEVNDDDTAGVEVSTESLSLSEGGQGSYTIALGTEPSADVRIDITAGGDVTASPATLTFTPTTWSDPQTITVVDSSDADAVNDSVTITHRVLSGDSSYDDVTVADVRVEVNDDDAVGAAVAPTVVSVMEGARGSYTIKLNTEPDQDVTIDITAGGDVSASPASLTFTPDNWSTTQTVTVRAAHDDDAADDSVTITHTASSTDREYSDVDVDSVTVNVTDDEVAGVTVRPSSLSVAEGGHNTYTLVLDAQPNASVTIKVIVSGNVTASPESVRFTADNWRTAKTVAVTAAQDDDSADEILELFHTVETTDASFGDVDVASIQVRVSDGDPGGRIEPGGRTEPGGGGPGGGGGGGGGAPPGDGPPPGDDTNGFEDIGDSGVHEEAVRALVSEGVMDGTGCEPGRLCSTKPLPRWEMAVWLVRVLDGADPEPPQASRFSDVGTEWWYPHVERLAELRITVGCSTEPARYCPDDPVTRAQMASFLVRAFALDQAPSAGFGDTAGNSHEDNINALFATGITHGCSTDPLMFCPRQSTNRGQMASFLHRALTRQNNGNGNNGN